MEEDCSQVGDVDASSFLHDGRYELHCLFSGQYRDLEQGCRMSIWDGEQSMNGVRIITDDPCGCVVDEEAHGIRQQLVQLLVGMVEQFICHCQWNGIVVYFSHCQFLNLLAKL